jgi:predicted O-linked N-acetylglucosamine transferase (SPINDLY family)
MCTLAKVNEKVIALWSRLLNELPTSRLILRSRGLDDSQVADEVVSRFEKHGIARERIETLGRIKLPKYLETFQRIDIELDPFPYSAHTTTCHALWMGVPVITLSGETTVSRVSASLLKAIGLPELIATSADEYISIVKSLGGDLERLETLRAGLRQRMLDSPLLDGPQFTKNLESAYRNIWREWCGKRAEL